MPAWLLALIGGAAAATAHAAASGTTRQILYLAVGATATVTVGVAIRLNRPPQPAMWYLIGAAILLYFAGDVVSLKTESYPSAGDAFYLGSYAALISALLLRAREYLPRRHLCSLVEAAIVSVSVAVVFWGFLIAPYAQPGKLSPDQIYISVAYPFADLLVVSVVARLSFMPGARPRFVPLLVLGLLSLIAGDVVHTLEILDGTVTPSLFSLSAWMGYYVFVPAAALHPATRQPVPKAPPEVVPGLSRRRLLLLVATSLIAPAVFAVERVRGSPVNVGVTVIGTLVLSLLVISRVVIERRRTEDALRRESRLLHAGERNTRFMIDTVSDPFISVDARGVITEWNRRAEVAFGWSGEEAVGRLAVETVIPGLDCDAPFLDGGTEMLAVRRDGQEFPVELSAWHVESDSGRFFNAFVKDLTARKEAEEALARARDEALQASQLKSQFLANMSHEIRTPMNGVIGLTHLLLDTELSSTQRRYAEGVHNAGEALLSVINDILDFSKIEAGRLEFESVPFDVRQLVEDVVELVAEPARRKGLEVIGYVHPELPTGVQGDPGRLRQVLLNLAANAVKFTEHGEVVVRARPAGEAGQSIPVCFEVEDTGIGISAEAQKRLFDPFSQADVSTTRRYGGTGLGLSIAQQLIQAMGGEISLRSEPGRGSTFCVTISLPARPDGPPPRPDHRLAGLRVLVVDDNETNRVVLERQLAAWGVRSTAVPGGVEALGALRDAQAGDDPFAVAILDMHMPGMDGVDLAARIVADSRPAAPRLVLLTSGAEVDAETARNAGIEIRLTKPVRQSDVYDCLLRLTAPPVEAPTARRSPEPVPLEIRGHVLVVEDNEINQTVALGVLAKLGYRADVAANGLEALDAMSGVTYSAVLMDCHMPEMDGYEATLEIRRRDGDTRHTPVIAMTAGALVEDRERALATGMDDYLAKPVEVEQLEAVLQRWVAGESGATGKPSAPPPAPREGASSGNGDGLSSVLDVHRLDRLRRLGPPDGRGLLPRLAEMFATEAPAHLAGLRRAVDEGDAAVLVQGAHRLKGTAANLGAAALADACRALEDLGRSGRLADASGPLQRVATEVDRVRGELSTLDAGTDPT